MIFYSYFDFHLCYNSFTTLNVIINTCGVKTGMLKQTDLERKNAAVRCLEVVTTNNPKHWTSILHASRFNDVLILFGDSFMLTYSEIIWTSYVLSFIDESNLSTALLHYKIRCKICRYFNSNGHYTFLAANYISTIFILVFTITYI